MRYIYVVYAMILFSDVIYAAQSEKDQTWKKEHLNINKLPQNALALYALNVGLKHLRGNETIVQYGLHDAGIAELLAQRIPEGNLVAIGTGTEIRAARSDSKVMQKKNLVLQNSILSENGDKDYVLSFLTPSWFKDQEALFTSFHALLKKGGKVLLLLTHENDPLYNAYCDTFKSDKWKQYFEAYKIPFYPSSEISLKQMLTNIGFEQISLSSENAQIDPILKSDFKKAISELPGVKDRIPENSHSDFFDDVINHYIQRKALDENGNILLGSGLLVAIATK